MKMLNGVFSIHSQLNFSQLAVNIGSFIYTQFFACLPHMFISLKLFRIHKC